MTRWLTLLGPTLPAAGLPDAPEPQQTAAPRAPRRWAAVSLSLLVVVLAVGGWVASRDDTVEDTAAADVAATPVEGAPQVAVDEGVGAGQGTVAYRDITSEGPPALDGSGDEVQLTNDLANVNSPSFSADGERLVFSSDSRGDFDLWVLTPSTGALASLLVAAGDQTDPDWSG